MQLKTMSLIFLVLMIKLTLMAKSYEVTINGGFDIGRNDHGRPVTLIAAGLNVPPDVFREAFSGVTPAPAGKHPTRDQERKNKTALMHVLATYGVTDERLNQVSDYYRYNPGAGEKWPLEHAAAEAIVENGVLKGFIITNEGSGYTSTPTVTVSGIGRVPVAATIELSSNLELNGRITSLNIPHR